jgi:hypothetical protein
MTKFHHACAAVAAAVFIALPSLTAAQTQMSGSQQTAMLSSSLAHFDRETQLLAGLSNQISSHDIVPLPIRGLQLDSRARHDLVRGMSGSRHTALEAALSKATVADVDRANGQSPDQSSLAEFLQRSGIDPQKVVAVDVDNSHDAQNPRVTIFYRGKLH